MKFTLFSISVLILISGCVFDSGEEWRDSPYIVLWIDTYSNRTLNYDLGDGASVGRVDSTVVAVGSNKEYVVAQQLIVSDGKINYYIIERIKDHESADSDEFVLGPLSKEMYEMKKKILGLPEFTAQF